MKYKFYTTSERAWDAMLHAIAGARKSIYLEMYVFVDNIESHRFFEILSQKAKDGLDVKIIIDSIGSTDLKAETIKKIRESGAELIFYSYWLQRTHKKILVVDERIAFLGGVNVHKIFRKWNDLQIRLEDGSIVESIIRSFSHSYGMRGGKDKRVLVHGDKETIFSKTKLWIIGHQQLLGKKLIKEHYKKGIQNAKRSISIVTPYFAPGRWLIGELHQAALRGVEVRIILPQVTDHWITDRVNYFNISRLYPLGIKFYLEDKMNHAKAMLIDDSEGLVGSYNIDPLSFDYNLEAGVFFREENMVRDLKEIMENWVKHSVIYKPSFEELKWYDYFLALLIRLFEPVTKV